MGDVFPSDWPINAEPLWRFGVSSHDELVTEPTAEPIDLDVVRDLHLRGLNGASEDEYIAPLITVSRQEAEYYTRRAIPPQTWALVLDKFPRRQGSGPPGWNRSAVIRVPRPPVIAIRSITYYDTDGVLQTLDSSTYQTDLPKGPYAGYGRIRPVPGQWWPETQRHRLDAVRVTFDCGYVNATVSPPVPNPPANLLHGMLLLIGELYKVRSESVPTGNTPALIRAKNLWSKYRVY